MNISKIIIRLALAAILGGIIGFEREKHGRVAGFRTHVLVTVGSALIMMVSIHLYNIFKPYQTLHHSSGVDPSRIASMVVVGIGFIGAGTVIKSRGNIWGLTTAACLWMAAALGLAVGCGYYIPAIFATIISLCTLVILKEFEYLIKRDWYYNIEIEMQNRKDSLELIKKILHTNGFTVLRVEYKKNIPNNESIYNLNIRSKTTIAEDILDVLSELPGIKNIICN